MRVNMRPYVSLSSSGLAFLPKPLLMFRVSCCLPQPRPALPLFLVLLVLLDHHHCVLWPPVSPPLPLPYLIRLFWVFASLHSTVQLLLCYFQRKESSYVQKKATKLAVVSIPQTQTKRQEEIHLIFQRPSGYPWRPRKSLDWCFLLHSRADALFIGN